MNWLDRLLGTSDKKTEKPKVNRDGWSNVLTGIGTKLDKQSYARPLWVGLDRGTCEAIFASDDIGSKIASIIPNDGTREGIEWIIPGGEDPEMIKWLNDEFDRLEVMKKFNWAWTLARVYGGAVIYLSIDDGKETWEPVDWSNINRIQSLTVFDRWQLTIQSTDIVTDLKDPNFGLPTYYSFQTGSSYTTDMPVSQIHYSRILRFDGQQLPIRLYKQNGYWNDSIYSKLYKSIRNYSTSYDNVANLMTDFNQPVFKVEGLAEALAMDQDQLVMKKIETVQLSRSIARAVILDKQDDFEQIGASVGGMAELLRMTTDRLVSGSGIPHTRLLGESPSGLGATGRSEMNDYYDTVKAQQELVLRNPLNQLIDALFYQENDYVKPDGFTFEFRPLYQTDEATKINTRKVQADIDAIYIDRGVYDPQTVTKARFGAGEYSFETSIDQELLQESNMRNQFEPPT